MVGSETGPVDYSGEDIELPAEPTRSAATVIKARSSTGETQAFWTPATGDGWEVNNGPAIVSWPDVVAEAIRFGWLLSKHRATP